MEIKIMPLGQLGTNCYIVYNEERKALIIDPGAEPEKVIHFIQSENLIPEAILITHAHYDHVGAVGELRTHYNIDVYLHEEEASWLENPPGNMVPETNRPEHILKQGNLNVSAFQIEVVHTPGHSPGSVSFIFHDEKCVFSGDVLFQQGVGRTDLPGGSFDILQESIRSKLYPLPDTYTVFPGHGTRTTIGFQKQNNPFVPA